jgi:hypothetical protein
MLPLYISGSGSGGTCAEAKEGGSLVADKMSEVDKYDLF